MSIASLLVFPETEREANVFAFEHAMAHRGAMLAFATVLADATKLTPLSDFSVLPYVLDPMQNAGIPATKWNLNHQQAHNDMHEALASPFGIVPTPPGVLPGQILIEGPVDIQGSQQWWTFSNHTEHLFALYALNWLTEFNYPSW